MFGRGKARLQHCSLEEIELEGDNGQLIPSVAVTCLQCGHCVESFGTSEASITRCLVVMRNECPELENYFYVTE